ncbi:DnaA/Hda family protein [Streptococcus uberis]|uniref:DnaA ATPase domain-containing protein n=1 Tax=Streptococcus uberis TaxID=1349 RepID=UPI0022B875A1|nr:DnaA/Hda family protein [Streptococcus uberis]MCZ8466137.1 DnaA/Hda family protein [Streptococcus uberis]
MIIHGTKGTGKSQLLKTAVKVIHEQNKFEFSSAESLKNYGYSEAYKIVLISAENLTKEILEILIFSDIKYVLIDDLQLLPKDSDIEEKLFLLNESGYIQLIATSNVEPRDLDICEKLKDQLNLGMVVNIIPEISN